jgi:hypothetical protein
MLASTPNEVLQRRLRLLTDVLMANAAIVIERSEDSAGHSGS